MSPLFSFKFLFITSIYHITYDRLLASIGNSYDITIGHTCDCDLWHHNQFLNCRGDEQARSQNLEKGGLFWKTEKSANDLDPNFHCSWISFIRFVRKLRRNFSESSEIQRFFPSKMRWSPEKKKKKVFTEIESDFLSIFANSNVWGGAVFAWGGYFQFFTKNRLLKHQKRAILHTSQANGGATLLGTRGDASPIEIWELDGEKKNRLFLAGKTLKFLISTIKSLWVSAKTYCFWRLPVFGQKNPSNFWFQPQKAFGYWRRTFFLFFLEITYF